MNPCIHRGFTLLEVMVTVLVLSIGLLGLAGLQATSLKLNSSAYLRSQATNLAYDMADRMRANRQVALSGAYDGTAATTCQVINPTGDMAEQDVAAWGNALACTLPQGAGSIATNGGIVTIVVQWDDSRGELPAQQFSMETDL